MRARVDHGFQRRPLEVRRTFHGVDEVRNQVRAPLILALDLRPLLIDLFIESDQVVANADEVSAADQQRENECSDASKQTDVSHDQYSSSSSSTSSSRSSAAGAGVNSSSSGGSSTTRARPRVDV